MAMAPAVSSHSEADALIENLSISLKLSIENDKRARKEALRLSKALVAVLEEPENVALELAISAFLPMSARVATDLNLFYHIVSHEGPITAAQLASLSGGEVLLITRILRPLSAAGVVKEVGEQTWEATPISKAMASDGIAAGHRVFWEILVGTAAKAPKYFKEAGHRCPTDPRDGIMQYAFQTKLPAFEFFSTMPHVMRDFNTFMGDTVGAREHWVDWYPVQERIFHGATKDSALIVDVGGGKGHNLQAFRRKYPEQRKLVLQDQSQVIDNIEDLDPVIERVKYDFFTDQPIQGARVYSYHRIFHDWSDDKCQEILQHVRKAMKPGYSKLLVHDLILPEQGASTHQGIEDLVMMSFNGGMERTEKQWRLLLERAGFEIVKMWVPEEDIDGIVEAIVNDECPE